jgi:tripartite-type tricarboxylate transporter receptor subunit TctC
LPDVPTANESGLPGFESVLHYGLLAPAGTPPPLTSTPEDYAKDIDSEETKWGTLVRKLNLKVE